jgi:hypothetical protein
MLSEDHAMALPRREDFEKVQQESLQLAMRYLHYTGAAKRVMGMRSLCAAVILAAWRRGEQDRVKLADYAVHAVERPTEQGLFPGDFSQKEPPC